jgi:hypothetical protein
LPKQIVGLELFYGGAWVDVAALDDVLSEAPIVIKRGQSDEGSSLRPCSLTCRLANDDDRYRISNPASPLYGQAGRNTPVRAKVGGTVRGIVEASSWAADQTRDFRASPRRGKAWVDLEGGGVLRRIGQWTEPLRSPFYVHNAALTTSVGYWPLEDAAGTVLMGQATSTNARSGGNPGIVFGGQTRPAGSAPLADFAAELGSGVRAYGYFRTGGDPESTAGWQVSFAARLGSLGELGTFVGPLTFDTTNGMNVSLVFQDGTNMLLLVNAASGAPLINATWNITGAGTDWSTWVDFVITGTQSGGTTTVAISWIQEDGVIVGAFADTYAGNTSSPRGWRMNGGGFPDTVTLGHLIATTGVTEDLTSPARIKAFRGYPGELSAYRFARLCDLAGVGYYVSVGFARSMPMGPQPYGTLADNLKEMEATEDGLIMDYQTELRLYFLLRPDRLRQTPSLTLTPADLPFLPTEVTDDLDTHNIVTVSQRDGPDVTAEDATGPLGSAPPPVGVGEARQTIEVNLDEPVLTLPGQANWWLRRGTVNLPRFPQVTVDLNARPSIIAAVESVDVGDVIEITGFRENTIRLWVLGWTETIGHHTRKIVFTCAPDQQFNVGKWDDTGSRWDSQTTTLKTGVNTTATAWTFRTTSSKGVWSSTTPYDVLVAGERVTVTAMGAAAVVSGAYEQAATVTRSVNGIVKSQSAAAEIHEFTPGRWA